ncbi:DUF4232 domain-containing protein [Streptomyces sp. NPDC048514]|uniref:DUF4232 domain-containing protein n=1 Tax=Streptomyces sp. NPDC048514 TaxID=3365564 RepID=UPI00371727D2
MRATTRLAGGLSALMAGLALTACGAITTTATHSDGSIPPCRTTSLKWTLTLLDGTDKGGERAGARLTGVNKGPEICVFDGYPGVEVHNGKAETIDGAGKGHPESVAVPEGAGVSVDLHYTPRGAKGAAPYCVRQSEAVVQAPHDAHRAVVPIVDTHGRTKAIDACGEKLTLQPPRRTPAGS